MQVRELASSCLLFYTGCASLPLLLSLDKGSSALPVTETTQEQT
jgi:hypothetical protein